MNGVSDELLRESERLVGERCWSFSAGAGTGSHLSLSFGRRIPRPISLTNPNLAPGARENDAEYSLFVECVWRLDDENGVVCGAWDDNRTDGPMLQGLARLPGHRVTAVLLRRPSLDLELAFDHGLRLAVFCDQVNEEERADNYSVFLPQTVIVVGPRSVPRVELRPS